MKRVGRVVAIAVLALVVAVGGYVAHLGYFGGPVFTTVPTRAASRDGTVAIFFSGDMGFETGMGPRIVRHLSEAGIPVVAANSLTAFARWRSPEQATALVEQAVERALALPGAKRVALIGQSFGANIVLAAAPSLPPALKRRVIVAELIVPADTMQFRATPGGILDFDHDGPATPYGRALDDLPVLCISGRTEPGSLCPLWRQPNVQRLALPGDHFLQHDDALVAAALLRTIREVR